MSGRFDVRPRVSDRLAADRAVVALETAVVTHGLPWPHNLEAAGSMEAAVREAGAEPATIGVLDGRIVVGLEEREIETMARADDAAKLGARDLVLGARGGRPGGTTVGATVRAAARVGIRVMATGGIGGVHRGAEESFDVSADLGEMARHPVLVVSAGAKSILDLPRTMELLETLGVAVIGFGTRELPGFYTAETGLRLEHTVSDEREVADLAAEHFEVLGVGLLLVQPPPAVSALARRDVEAWIRGGLEAAGAAGVRGKDTTPWLLDHVARASGGATLRANLDLLRANAALAGRIAAAGRG